MFRLLAIALALSYPFVIYFGTAHISPAFLAGFLAAIVLLRVFTSELARHWKLGALSGVIVLGLLQWSLRGGTQSLMFYPVLLNTALLIVFGQSLFREQSLIETIARKRNMDVGPHNLGYLRVLTAVWTGFFVISVIISTLTAVSGNMSIWLLYNGLVSYLLMGVLIVGELIVRYFFKRRLAHQQP